MTVNGQRVRATIGDDRDDRRAALRWALQAAGAEVVAEAVTAKEFVRLSLRHQPELVVVDPLLGPRITEDLVPRILAGVPGARVIVGDRRGYHAPREGVRLHAVPTLAPGAVVALVRRLSWSVPRPTATAVVGLPDTPFRPAVVTALGREGIATVDEVTVAAEAYRSVRDLAPDLLVVDLSLTGMSGWLSLRQLSQEYPSCRVVVMSPLGAPPLAVLEVGVAAVLAVGDVAGLRQTVRRLLRDGQEPTSAVSAEDVSPAGRRMVNPPAS